MPLQMPAGTQRNLSPPIFVDSDFHHPLAGLLHCRTSYAIAKKPAEIPRLDFSLTEAGGSSGQNVVCQSALGPRYLITSSRRLGKGAWGSVWDVNLPASLYQELHASLRLPEAFVLKTVLRADNGSAWARNARKEVAEREFIAHLFLSKNLPNHCIRLLHTGKVFWKESSGKGDGMALLIQKGSSLEFRQGYVGSTVHQVISAILNMHKLAVCHGDLKRDNLLIRGGAVVLADFGLSGFLNRAKGIPQSKWPQFSFSIGRYQDYRPPELSHQPLPGHAFVQVSNDKYLPEEDHADTSHPQGIHFDSCAACQRECIAYDLWSLGCLILDLCGGNFDWDTEKGFHNSTSTQYIITRILHPSNNARYHFFAELVAALLEFDPHKRYELSMPLLKAYLHSYELTGDHKEVQGSRT